MLNEVQRDRIRAAYASGKLRVKSCGPDGQLDWKKVLEVSRSEVGPETIVEVATSKGVSVLTGGHRVFLTPTSKIEAEKLCSGDSVSGVSVVSVRRLPSRQYMYDLTAEDWHNFFLVKSGMLVSNSPDRNYHFRPPAHETTVSQFNRVFGYIWEDAELQEYLLRSLDMISAAPPRTVFTNCQSMIRCYPDWRTLLLNGAMLHAIFALMMNWVADEFSLSGDSVVRVRTPDLGEIDISLQDLHSICND